jgi:outer membrane protein
MASAEYGELTATLPGLVGDLELDSPLGVNVDLVKMVSPNLGIELMLGASRHEASLCSGSQCVDAGSMWILPISVSLSYRPQLMGTFHPYVGAGAAFTFLTNPGPLDNLSDQGLTRAEYEGELGMTIHAGLDYDLSRSWIVNLDLRYLDSPVEVEVGYAGLDRIDRSELDLDPWTIGLGFGCRF